MASDEDDAARLGRLTVRELRERAVKSLGAQAAALKTRQELVAALTNAHMRQYVPLLVAAAKEYESALHRGALDDQGRMLLYLGKGKGDDDGGLLDRAGVAPKTWSNQARKLAR